ncbi:MAG: hypothetical protein QOD07_173, partial [Frankiaceae bacterium]|nr:hypothetical protein [Frankiaceae bacterium]
MHPSVRLVAGPLTLPAGASVVAVPVRPGDP